LVFVSLFACASEPPSVDVAADPPPARITTFALAATPFIDAKAASRLAAIFEKSGLRGARIRCEDVSWDAMQPDPAGAIDFTRLDAFVTAHQRHGLGELLVCLDTGVAPPSRRGELGTRGSVPAPELLGAYSMWVGAVVERYDADGVDDMAGLLGPVRLYEVGIEFASRPAAGIEPYLLLLQHAHQAAHTAFADVVVAHAGLLVAAEPEADVSPRLGVLDDAALGRLFEQPERFDAINLQVIADASSLDATLAELGARMTRRGFHKPVLLSHLAPSPLIAWGKATSCEGLSGELGVMILPAVEANRCPLAAHFRRLIASDPGALAWSWRFAAAELVRKSVVAASHRVSPIYAGPTLDAPWWQEGAFQAGAGLSAWAGLVDVETRNPRPALSALEQLSEAFGGRESVTRVDMGRSDVRLYALQGGAGTIWVAWHQAEGLAQPGEERASISIEFDVGGGGLSLTRMAGLTAGPSREELSVNADRRVHIALTSEPVYLRPLAKSAPRRH
jgi:hypothetical protein